VVRKPLDGRLLCSHGVGARITATDGHHEPQELP
jgi:hypothetical protein